MLDPNLPFECYSPSLSIFPPDFFSFHPTRPFQTQAYHYIFCICNTLCISVCVWAAISVYIISPFYQLYSSLFPLMHSSRRCIAHNFAIEVTFLPVLCLSMRSCNKTRLHTFSWKLIKPDRKNVIDSDSHLIFSFILLVLKIYQL